MNTRMLGTVGACLAVAGLSFAAPCASAESVEVATQCAGVESGARESSFTSWSGVSKPARITRTEQIGKAIMVRTAGVQLFVPAKAGLSTASMQQLVECQLAQAAEQGGSDALAVPGIAVHVERRGDGYRVRLTSDNVRSAQELARRMGL